MKKTIIIITLLVALLIPVYPAQSKTVTTKTYHSMKLVTRKNNRGKYTVSVYWKNKKHTSYAFTRKPKIKFISTQKLTYNQLISRKKSNILYVELIIGKQIDKKGNGRILNTDPNYNYISYRKEPFNKGDKIRTYCIYNPYTDWEDDISERFDEKIR